MGPDAGRAAARPVTDHLDRFRGIIAASDDLADMRRRMGASALATDLASDGSGSARWRATVASRLPSQDWPRRTMLVTAVDAHTGEPVVLDRHSGVDLVDAVAASTSGGGSAYRIHGRGYIDGGYRANAENADLADGYERVLVLSPFGGRSLYPAEWGTHLATQVAALRARRQQRRDDLPRTAARAPVRHQCDGRVPASGRGARGHDQGRALAERLTGFWL